MSLPEAIVFVDLETTGGNPASDRITEIGIVELAQGQISSWSSLVNPQADIPVFIQQLTGITPEMVADAPTFGQLAREVMDRLKGRLFIAHNARFDYGFLKNQFKAQGMDFRATVLCTVKLSRRLYPQHFKHNLDSLVERHGLSAGDRHRALTDADLLCQFWQVIERDFGIDARNAAVAQLTQLPSLPSHLDPSAIEDLPESPGVYLFYGENDLPLYIGKSTQLRKRVLAHFSGDHRHPLDGELSQQLRRIEWHETAGELGALLLEARLVKEKQPLHNRQLRKNEDICSWQLLAPQAKPTAQAFGSVEPLPGGDFRPQLVRIEEVDVAKQDALYGLYPSPRQAKAALRKLADAHELCLSLIGLEKPTKGAGCFGVQLKTCRGACIGREPLSFHGARLLAALAKHKLRTWPWPGPVGLVESDALVTRTDVHVIDRWRYLGTAKDEQSVHDLLTPAKLPPFDQDVYKILVKAVQQGKLKVVDLRD